ncbi:MAG: YlbF family regulator [Roseburia sp.]|nr:YlbF family regulator [Roseburia sp.]MCM1279383.1 YlbF family regulator [Robinsoniella sp.]
MTQYDQELETFIKAVKNTDAFIEYEKQKERIKAYPDLKARLDEFRERNYRLQTSENTNELFEEIDKFTIEYEAFREIPMVHDFLQKELAYCRMIQQINDRLLKAFAVDFE